MVTGPARSAAAGTRTQRPRPELAALRAAAGTVADPEIPVLTLDDLGVIREVRIAADGTAEADITPTYTGCPATEVIAAAVAAALEAAGAPRATVRTVLSPAWTTDWMTEDGRRKLREFGIAPPGRAGAAGPGGPPLGRHWTISGKDCRADPGGALPALRLGRHPGSEPVRLHPVQGAVELPCVRRAVRLVQGDLMANAAAPGDAPAAGAAAGPEAPAGRRHSVFHPLRVASIERLTDDAVALTFEVPPELRADFAFRAGQHVSVRAPQLDDGVRRNYSICAPATSGVLRIGVKRIPGGVFSGFAAERLCPGDVLDVMTPTGSFCTALDPAQARCYAAIAAGSGITPVLSILATALQVEPASSAVLIYVNRSTQSIMFLEDLADLKNRYPDRFQLVHVLDEERRRPRSCRAGWTRSGWAGSSIHWCPPTTSTTGSSAARCR